MALLYSPNAAPEGRRLLYSPSGERGERRLLYSPPEEETEEERRKREEEERLRGEGRSVLDKSLRSLGKGLTTGLAGAIELPGKISAIPTALGLTEQSGEHAGMDAPYDLADWVRKLGPEKPEEGVGYGLLEGLGSIPGTVAKYGTSALAGGPIGAAVAMGGIDLAEKLGETGDIGEALKTGLISGAVGGALGGAAKIAKPLVRAGIGAGAMGGASLLEGASPQEAAMSAVMGGGLGVAFRERVKAKEATGTPRKSAEAEAIIELAREQKAKQLVFEQEMAANRVRPPDRPLSSTEKFSPMDEALPQNEMLTPELTLGKAEPLPDKLIPGPDLKPRRGQPNDFPINMTRMSDEPTLIKATEDLIRRNEEMLNAARGTKTFDEIQRESLQYGSVEEHAKMQKQFGDSLPARTLAQREIVNTYTHDLNVLAQKRLEAARAGATAEELDVLDSQINRATSNTVAMMRIAVSNSSNVGRALAVHRKMTRPADPAERAIWNLSKNKKVSDSLVSAAIAARNDPEALEKILRAGAKPSTADKAYEIWLNGILSGVKTHIVNMTSNTLMQGLEEAARPLTAANEAFSAAVKGRPRERFARESVAAVKGTVDGIRAGIVAVKHALDGNFIGAGKLENVHALPDKILGIPTPGKMLQVEDEFFKALTTTKEAYVQAYRTGRLAGKSHTEAMEGIPAVLGDLIPKSNEKILGVFKGKDILTSIRNGAEAEKMRRMAQMEPTAQGEIALKSLAKGKKLTFQEEGGTATKALQALKEAVVIPGTTIKPLGYVMPFIQTPINILKTSVEHSPLGIVDFMKASGPEAAEAMSRVQLGALMSIPIIVEAYQGNITGAPRDDMPFDSPFSDAQIGFTGGGPAVSDLRQNKMQTGWQPYSVAYDDGSGQKKYYSFERMEPFATILGLAADIGEARDEETARDRSAKLVKALSTNLTNKTFLAGMENLFKLNSDANRYYDSVFRNYAGSVIPSALGQAATALDPNVRDVSLKREGGLADTLQNRIPGASQSLPARTSATGVPVERAGNAFTRGVSPVAYSEDRPGMYVEKEFDRLKFVPDMPDRTIKDPRTGKKSDLTDDEFSLLAGAYRDAAAQVQLYMAHPNWSKIPDRLETGHDKVSMIKDIYRKHKRRAMLQIVANRYR